MKKWGVRIVLALLAVVIVVAVIVGMSLNAIVKKAVETIGPQITKVDVKLERARISPFSGKGEIDGLVVGNPPGFKTSNAISLGSASVRVKRSTLFSDPLILHSVSVQGPEITFEGNLSGNNLSKILANLEESSTSEKSSPSKSGKKIEVEDFVLQGGKINLNLTIVGSKSATVPLPDIHLTDLGRSSGGLTAAELSQKVLAAVLENTLKAVGSDLGKLGPGSAEALKDVGKGAVDEASKAAKGLGDLLKKK
jgi:hypothetical protein